jgi:phosphatidylserine/phosphatidylglycerophosphate/cardiolipin synthase-like enzyme
LKNRFLAILLLTVFLAGSAAGYAASFQMLVTRLVQEKDALKTENDHLQFQLSALQQQITTRIVGIYFSPQGGCEDQVFNWISRANMSVHILIYSFTLDSLGDALVAAHARGVEVKVVFEKGEIIASSQYSRLKAAGISVRNDTNSRDMHDKVLIVDGIIVLTGSFNWSTKAEEYNNENLIVINSTYVAGVYEQEFQKIWNTGV